MKQLVIVKTGSVNSKDKERLNKNGYVVMEHENPESVRVVNPSSDIYTNDLLMSALKGCMQWDSSLSSCTKELYNRLKAKEELLTKKS